MQFLWLRTNPNWKQSKYTSCKDEMQDGRRERGKHREELVHTLCIHNIQKTSTKFLVVPTETYLFSFTLKLRSHLAQKTLLLINKLTDHKRGKQNTPTPLLKKPQHQNSKGTSAHTHPKRTESWLQQCCHSLATFLTPEQTAVSPRTSLLHLWAQ